MKIITKSAANKVLVNSLFEPINGKTLSVSKFDSGKYEWKGNAKAYLGKEVPTLRGVHAVYVERRTDRNGAYAQIMCVSED